MAQKDRFSTYLVGGAEVWVGRARRALVVGHGGEGLQGVAEDVEARGDRDLLRHGLHVDRVDDAEGWLQSAVADAGLGQSTWASPRYCAR